MIKISKIFGDFVPRDPAFARAISRRSAILKIVEEKALGTRLLRYSTAANLDRTTDYKESGAGGCGGGGRGGGGRSGGGGRAGGGIYPKHFVLVILVNSKRRSLQYYCHTNMAHGFVFNAQLTEI